MGGFFVNSNGFLQQQIVTEKMGLVNSWLPIYLKDRYSYNKLVSYILKYISKDCVKLSSYYFRSKDLVLSSKKQISVEEFYNIMGNDYEFKYNNDFGLSPFCAISEYKFNELNQREQTLIMELEQKSKFMKK